MTRIRRGNYIFLTGKGDHAPRHVHVYRDRELVLKWDLDEGRTLEGEVTSRLLRLIRELPTSLCELRRTRQQEGKL